MTKKQAEKFYIQTKAPASKFNDTLFIVNNGGDEHTISGNTLNAMVADLITTPGDAAQVLVSLIHTATMSALNGNEQAIGNARNSLINAIKQTVKEKPVAVHPLVNLWLNAVREHNRFVDTLFIITNAKFRSKLRNLLEGGNSDDLWDLMMNQKSTAWDQFWTSIATAMDVSKSKAMEFKAMVDAKGMAS